MPDSIDLPHAVDVHVGRRVREVRQARNASLESLAAALGLSYQQVQKYELGRNRISASVLFEIGQALQVPISTFFEGLSYKSASPTADVEQIQLAAAFAAIDNAEVRRAVADLVAAMARATVRPSDEDCKPTRSYR